MKKIGLAIAIALFTLPAMADEEIKLAAALGSGGAETGASDGGGAAMAASSSASVATANMIAVGILAASGLAIAAEIDSSDSH